MLIGFHMEVSLDFVGNDNQRYGVVIQARNKGWIDFTLVNVTKPEHIETKEAMSGVSYVGDRLFDLGLDITPLLGGLAMALEEVPS
jgi:hypothetical protein